MRALAWPRAVRAHLGLANAIRRSRGRTDRPFKITWMATNRCDCRCEGCFIWKQKRETEVSPDDLGRLLAGLPSLAWVNLTGGELFLRDDVPDLAAAVRRALPHVSVFDFPTTGQRVDRIVADVEQIARMGFPRFYTTVSLEGPPDLHDKRRGRAGAFGRAVETYRALRSIAGVAVSFGVTLTEDNVPRLEEMREALADLGVQTTWRDIHFNVYTTSLHYYANGESGVRAPQAMAPLLQQALKSRRRWLPSDAIERAWLAHLPSYLATGRSPLPCQALSASVFVDARGDVHPCTIYGRVLGNVYEASLAEILAGPTARDAREVVVRDRCPGCWSPCEAFPTIVAQAPGSLARRPGRENAR